MPDSTLSTLAQIRTLVRQLTRSPSEAQLTTAQIDAYVNTFVLYDFPEHLRLFNLRDVFTWYCYPYVDTYDTNYGDPGNHFYNFKNKYISIHQPCYVAGYNVSFSQSREQFFSVYPRINQITQIATGDGITTDFSGTLGGPITAGQVLFNSTYGDFSAPLTLSDVPFIEPITGIQATGGSLIDPIDPIDGGSGDINYVTGAYNLHFPVAPGSGAVINAQTVPYTASRPQSILFYDGVFTLRPIPDQSYRIEMEAYIRPTEFLDDAQQPKLSEWFQYIAYGASRKVFQARMDMESLQNIEPEYKKQESLIQRRTISQYSNQRIPSIYIDGASGGTGNGWGWGGGSF